MYKNVTEEVLAKLQLKEKRVFDRVEFLNTLGKVFLENFQTTRRAYQNAKGVGASGEMPFAQFRELVSSFRSFYWELSEIREKSYKPPLSEGLWKAFYAGKVIPIRDKHYPRIASRIKISQARENQDWKNKLREIKASMES